MLAEPPHDLARPVASQIEEQCPAVHEQPVGECGEIRDLWQKRLPARDVGNHQLG